MPSCQFTLFRSLMSGQLWISGLDGSTLKATRPLPQGDRASFVHVRQGGTSVTASRSSRSEENWEGFDDTQSNRGFRLRLVLHAISCDGANGHCQQASGRKEGGAGAIRRAVLVPRKLPYSGRCTGGCGSDRIGR